MQRAFDPVAFHIAFAQRGIGVGADVVGGIKFATQVIKRDFLAGGRNLHHFIFIEIAGLGDFVIRKL